MIPYGRQDINTDDIDAVVSVLKSDFLTQGPIAPSFENALSDYCGTKYGVATNSATSSLHIACIALDLHSGDWLWTSPITFVASANCGLYCGAKVDFVDIDPRTYNMCPQKLEEKLIVAEKEGKLPKIVVPVHFSGQSCDMVSIHKLSKKYGFKIIEDASHAIGGKYKEVPIGCCAYSDITVFSFHPVKIITTGEGGMALTNNIDLAEKMRLLRSHGITRDPGKMTHSPDGPWYYQQVCLGFNYRMTELQAALGMSQLNRLEEFVKKRHEIAQRYNDAFAGASIKLPWQAPDTYSSFHLYVVRFQENDTNFSHREIFDYLHAKGIGVNLHYIPVHMQPYYLNMGFAKGMFEEAEKYYSEAISMPIYSHLSVEDQDLIISTIKEVLKK